MASLHRPVREVFESSGFMSALGEEAVYESYHEAMDALRTHLDHDVCGNRCPY